MRKALPLLVLFHGLIGSASGQQLTQYSQYVFYHFSVNPAVAGSKDCLDMRLGVRKQWLGFDGAPTTGWFSLHGTLRAKGKPFQPNKHGIGVFMEADEAGNWGYSRLLLAYAYHLQMAKEFYLAFGVFAGLQQEKFDFGNATVLNYDDPALTGRSSVLVYPDVTPGIWFYNKSTWGGVSLHNVVGNRIDGIGTEARLSRHLMLSAGHRFRMGRKMALVPSTLIKRSPGAPVAFDLNAMAEWGRVFGLGVGYRSGDAVVAMMKVGFLKYFQLGYSYDMTTSRLRLGSSNTHEVILAITPCDKGNAGKRMISCPAFE
jgi:type IX secretion system PorP/SprF family membrane protein